MAKRREMLQELYGELSVCRGWQWQKAQGIMNHITAVKGTGRCVVPRVCKRCDFYGHTKQYCKETDPEIVRHNLEFAEWKGMTKEWLIDARDAFEEAYALDLPPCVHEDVCCVLRGLKRCEHCVRFNEAHTEAKARIRRAKLLGDEAVCPVIHVPGKGGE
jgi:hypothetical protein